MAKLTVDFQKVHCIDTTSGLGDDEIYFAVFPSLLRRKAGGKVEESQLAGVLSEVKGGVDDGTVYRPKLKNGTSSFSIDPGDAGALALVITLYEEDDGELYEKLEKETTAAQSIPPKTEFGEIKDFVPKDPTSWAGWVKIGFKLLALAWKHFRTDDRIASRGVRIELDDPASFGPRELRFEGEGGKYRLALSVSAS